MSRKSDPDRKAEAERRLIAAAMTLAAEKGWRDLTLAEIAGAAETSLADLYRHFPGKLALLRGIARQADAAVLAGPAPDMEERPHDRVFDVLMRRFDALEPYRAGLRVVWRELRGDPSAALCVAPQLPRSMAWMLEAAGLPGGGLAGMLKARGLAAVWLATLRVWFEDDSPDLARTMAALDANLRRAEEVWNSVSRPRRRATATEAPAP